MGVIGVALVPAVVEILARGCRADRGQKPAYETGLAERMGKPSMIVVDRLEPNPNWYYLEPGQLCDTAHNRPRNPRLDEPKAGHAPKNKLDQSNWAASL